MNQYIVYYYLDTVEYKLEITASNLFDAVIKARGQLYHQDKIKMILVKEYD